MKSRSRVAIALSILLILSTGVGRASHQQAQPPAYKAGVELVTVDLTVLNRGGEPIVDLKIPDVTVLVDGKPRPIVSLRLIRADSAEEAAPPLPPPVADVPSAPLPAPPIQTGRRFVLAVDRDQITRGEGQQMLEAGARFIDRLTPADRIAVWAIPAKSSRLQFSNDREAAKRELRRMVGTEPPPFGRWVVAKEDAVQIVDGSKDVLASVIARECYRQPPTCPQEVEAQARTLGLETRDRTTISLVDIEGLIDALGTMEGPKHLVWITGSPPWLPEHRSTVTGLGAKAAAARVTVHALQVFVPSYQARTDSMRATTVESATLASAPLESVSAAFALAGATGGLAITPVTGEIGFKQLSRELSASYLLAFEAETGDRDGKVHAIDVRVADRGWGVSVRARRSFQIVASAAPAVPVAPSAPTPGAPPASAPAPPAEPGGAAPDHSAAVPVGTDPGEMTTRLADYVTRFENSFSAVVAEERYVQIVHPWRGNPKGPESEASLGWFDSPGDPGLKKGGPIISRRQLLSDVLLVQTSGKRWTGYRDVAEVDGAPVRNRAERVRDLFLSKSPDRDAQFQTITGESARYNLGDFRRTLNIPTVTLSFMSLKDAWRFEFNRARDEKIDGRVARVLTFKEKARPTLIGTPGGTEIPIEGRIWLDADTGRVLRTELRFDRGAEKRSLIRTDFAPLPGVDVLVPVLMWEWYEGANQLGRIGGDKTLVQCVATYSNFRRFQVSTAEQIK